jgi:glycosyltransferase involved in cell wall biosynthesis
LGWLTLVPNYDEAIVVLSSIHKLGDNAMPGRSIRNLAALLLNPKVTILDRCVWVLFLLGEELENFLYKFNLLSRPNWQLGKTTVSEHVPIKNEDYIDLDNELSLEIVNYEKGFGKSGVLSKIVANTEKALLKKNLKVTQSSRPTGQSDFVLHVFFRYCIPVGNSCNIALVTHIDSYFKMRRINWLISRNVNLICFSNETKNFILHHCDSPNVSNDNIEVIFPSPANLNHLRKLKIGFFSNVYRDGRKREFVFDQLLDLLRPEDVVFYTMGEGLEPLVSRLLKAQFLVVHSPKFDSNFYENSLASIDLLIYTGLDEGAMSVVDALHAGVPVVATRVGFHLDIQKHDQLLFFDDVLELAQILNKKAAVHRELSQILPIKNYDEYGSKLCDFLERIRKGRA